MNENFNCEAVEKEEVAENEKVETTETVEETAETETVSEREDVCQEECDCDCNEQQESTELPPQEEKEEQVEVSEDLQEMIKVIDAHFVFIRNLLKYNKEKDTNIGKMNNELSAYREGFYTKLFKSIALNLIGLREDNAKALREFKDKGLTKDQAKKYLNYAVYDSEDLLQNLNITVDGDRITYNGKDIDKWCDGKIKSCPVDDFVLPEEPVLKEKTLAGVTEYLGAVQSYTTEVLKMNEHYDKILRVFIENTSVYEQGVHQVLLYPAIKKIAKAYLKTVEESDAGVAKLTDENATEIYVECISAFLARIEEILEVCGVTIDSQVSDKYDPIKHRILKSSATNLPELNGKVIARYTDCYEMEGKVIYPQKVDVLKYQN